MPSAIFVITQVETKLADTMRAERPNFHYREGGKVVIRVRFYDILPDDSWLPASLLDQVAHLSNGFLFAGPGFI
jgi:hypothetical protein